MRYLFHLGHPAHFHLFKNVIKNLNASGHECAILIKKKDILEELLQKSGISYHNLLPYGRSDSKLGITWGMIKTDIKLFLFTRNFKPNLLIGTSYAISHVGKLLNIPSININEDDAGVVPLYSRLSYPWAKEILTPLACNNGKWNEKSIKYAGYHELAYLHPNNFTADINVVKPYFNPSEPYFILRFAKLKAHHDSGIGGITTEMARELIRILSPHGKIYITAERELESEFEPYRMVINPLDIHHIMAFAKLYIGDSQTMAAEAGVLGTPFIRINDFVRRIGYLNELENNFLLGFGLKPDNEQAIYSRIEELVENKNLKEEWIVKRQKMLNEKIDVSAFLTWFIENYPKSAKTIRENPDYQNNFK